MYLIGEASEEIGAALTGLVPTEDCGTLAEAVARAHRLAQPGDTVLLSPACASFDQYPDFEVRGDHFRRVVEQLTATSNATLSAPGGAA